MSRPSVEEAHNKTSGCHARRKHHTDYPTRRETQFPRFTTSKFPTQIRHMGFRPEPFMLRWARRSSLEENGGLFFTHDSPTSLQAHPCRQLLQIAFSALRRLNVVHAWHPGIESLFCQFTSPATWGGHNEEVRRGQPPIHGARRSNFVRTIG